jgi:hypothetical protein
MDEKDYPLSWVPRGSGGGDLMIPMIPGGFDFHLLDGNRAKATF